MSDAQQRTDWDPPAGHYVLRLDEARLRHTAEDDRPFLEVKLWVLEGTDPKWVDRAWRRRMYLTPRAERYTKADLRAMGFSRRAASGPDCELLVQERATFECDVVYLGKWPSMRHITPRIELRAVPPTGAPEPTPEPELQPGDPGFYDY
jgi:hypothetical protein